MKKYISVILVLVMACSLLYAIPAQAALTVGDVNVSEDFESISDVSIYGAGTSLNIPATENETRSMNVVEADAASYIEFAVAEPVLGSAYTLETMIKVNGATANKIHLTFNGKNAVVKDSGVNSVIDLEKDYEVSCDLAQDTWTHVKTNVIWNGVWDNLGTATVLDVENYTVTLNIGDNEALTYDIDDVKIGIPAEYAKLDSSYPYTVNTYDETAEVGKLARASWEWKEDSVNGVGGSQYFQHFGNSNTPANMSGTTLNVPYIKMFESPYRVSAYFKLDKEITAGTVTGGVGIYVGGSPVSVPNATSIRSTLADLNDGDWSKFEAVLDPIDIGLATSASYIPRLGDVGGGATLSVFSETPEHLPSDEHPLPYAFYMDDFIVEPYVESPDTLGVPKLSYVESENVECYNLVGSYFKMDYNYAPIEGEVESKVRVRVLQEFDTDKFAILDQFYGDLNGFVFEIPESANGKKLRFEVMPYDKNEDDEFIAGYQIVYTTDVITDTAEDVSVELNDFDETGKTISGTVTVSNEKINGDSLNLFAMVALYNEKGALLRIDTTPITVANGDVGTSVTFTTLAFNDIYDDVKSAKVFVWGGESLDVTNRKAYTAIAEKTK
ncbi:MAG: hypothetical protein IKU15_09465 [Clostridia bacterium]|nr:hypothetical protein [Clostridia bacterium]